MGLPENNCIIIFLLVLLVFPVKFSKAQDPKLLFPFFFVNKTHFVFSRPTFAPDDYQFISATGDASIAHEALQVTPDSANVNYSLFSRSGRCMFRRAFRIWNIKNHDLISFTSIFDINVSPARAFPNDLKNAPAGEGLAFVIASNLITPTASSGGFLGLTNQTRDRNPSNKFIAIELDTVKGDTNEDPNNNHIGLDINSIISNTTVNLTDIKIASGVNYTVWIQYNGKTMNLTVYMGLKGKPKPENPFLNQEIDLSKYLEEYSYFGFSAATGIDRAQLNCILRWDLTVEILPEDNDRNWIILLGAPGLFVLAICVVGLGYYLHKWRVKDDLDILVALKSLPGVPKEYMFKDLKEATNNFDEKLKLGQGGFGVVYKGVLPNDFEYKEIAVKKFLRERTNSKFDFLAELDIINRLRHKHLVRLAGWCHKNDMLLLVYEFMPHNSVDRHLYGGSDTILGWNHRYKIASGLASALEYLHNGYEQVVVHRDIKASNIMLDSDYNARLGDFGLARVIERERNSFVELGGFPGTLGYIAPECFHTGKSTKESDVFAFGAVVLELICGKRPWTSFEEFENLLDWVWKLHGQDRILETVDARLGDVYVVEEARRLLLLGLACSHPNASARPKTETIFQIISGSVPVPSVSLRYMWPSIEVSRSIIDECNMKTSDDEDETPMKSAYYTAMHSVFVPNATTITTLSSATSIKDVNIDETHNSLQLPAMQLRMQLHSTKKGEMSVSEYLLQMQSLADKLAALGRPISEDDLVIRILSGLGPQYSAFVMALITGHESIKFGDVQKFLLVQEVQMAMEPSNAEYNAVLSHQNKFQLWHWIFQ